MSKANEESYHVVDSCSGTSTENSKPEGPKQQTCTPPTDVNETKAWSPEECRNALTTLFDSSKKVHNVHVCGKTDCTSISHQEEQRLIPKKFQHNWMTAKRWWLCYIEGEGMYCLPCRKYGMKHPQNQKEVFAATPSVRMKINAMNVHSTCNLHTAALDSAVMQKSSIFEKEIIKKHESENIVLEQVFATAYFQMKSFIANQHFIPLLTHIQTTFGVENLKYFDYNSKGSHQEIFQTLGQALKNDVINKVKSAGAYGVLTDEVSDISVTENLVTFIQFFSRESGSIATQFLACNNLLANFDSPNAEAITSVIVNELEGHGLSMEKFTGFTSDGASVMMGKRTGVAARLKEINPVLLNVHCICHRLALACTDSNTDLKYISTVETVLRQVWQFLDNSPKRMATYLKIQARLKAIHFEGKAFKKISKRLKKAVSTRWLSFEAAIKAVFEDYESVLQTLAFFKDTDAVASGLFGKMKNLKFLGVVYILNDILPILANLSKDFQTGSITFATIVPSINRTKDKLKDLLEDNAPIERLSKDVESLTDVCSDIKMNPREAKELENLFASYIAALIENIDRRFCESSPVLEAFNIFDPMMVPDQREEIRYYGQTQMQVLAEHYFRDKPEEGDRLKAEWEGLKYHIRDGMKPHIPVSVKSPESKTSPTEWCILQLLRNTAALKTRLRNRLSTTMLESLMHVCINGPEPNSPEAKQHVKSAVKLWLDKKERRKIPPKQQRASASAPVLTLVNAGVQTDVTEGNDELTMIETAVDIAIQKLNLASKEYDPESDSELSDDDCCGN
ncbi:zinc finger protein 862-like isoform X2 [Dreissena polymorpha]|uniref:zinc finger protein 862-like isoform X2 n=1 Tax=Dreissena polymorpha TaxID=45954 RepID=UPI002264A2BD|nr:zinc finger protein 862-like isoform X2 [Dreissena polymorpha]